MGRVVSLYVKKFILCIEHIIAICYLHNSRDAQPSINLKLSSSLGQWKETTMAASTTYKDTIANSQTRRTVPDLDMETEVQVKAKDKQDHMLV